jgi:hypothetical protein
MNKLLAITIFIGIIGCTSDSNKKIDNVKKALDSTHVTISIYLNLNQCSTCNIGFNGIKSLSGEIIKNIYFSESNKAASEEMMQPFGTIKNLNLKYYKEKDSLFKTNGFSYCVVFKNGIKTDSFELNALMYKVLEINNYFGKVTLLKTIDIPDSLKFSDRVELFFNKKHLNLNDYTLNKNVLFTFNDDYTKIIKVFSLKSTAFTPQPFLMSGVIDVGAYWGTYKDLEYIGRTTPQITRSYVTDSILYLGLTFPCAIPRLLFRDTAIGGKLFIYKKNLITLKSELYAMADNELRTPKKETYFSQLDGFYFINNKFYFSAYVEKKTKANYILAEYEVINNRLIFRSFVDYTIPDSTYSNYGKNEFFNVNANNSFYFGNDKPIFVSTKTNAVVNIEKELGNKYKRNLNIRDVYRTDSNIFKIIINVGKIAKYLVFDMNNRTLDYEMEINTNEKINIESLRFLNEHTLLATDIDTKHILFYELK